MFNILLEASQLFIEIFVAVTVEIQDLLRLESQTNSSLITTFNCKSI